MTGYALVNLKEMIEHLGEDKTKIILSNFMCPLNKDVDVFLKYKAIEFSKQGIAITYGDELLKLACDKVKAIQGEIGGRVVYLESEDIPELIDFYSSNGFVQFGKRRLDRDEVGLIQGKYLVQMLKYLSPKKTIINN